MKQFMVMRIVECVDKQNINLNSPISNFEKIKLLTCRVIRLTIFFRKYFLEQTRVTKDIEQNKYYGFNNRIVVSFHGSENVKKQWKSDKSIVTLSYEEKFTIFCLYIM